MNNIRKALIIITAAIFLSINMPAAMAQPAVSVQKTTTTNNSAVNYITVSPVDVVNSPNKYLNKNITFNADFVGFTSLGLDYKPAYRNSEKYVGILIKRDDIKDHVIPLSEMKIFITRETAEKNMDLDQGDKIKISGKVFSNALGDVWVDVKTLTVLTKKDKTNTAKK